jgi:dihydrodipicolinate synthase/N-acetylneuraminate lyase
VTHAPTPAPTPAPWHGIVVAIATPFTDDLSVDYDGLQEHVRWLAASGCRGVTPNGSLGEYQTLTDAERADIVRASVEAAPEGCSVVPGVAGYGGSQARRWTEQAADAGADAVLALPPIAYRATREEVLAHYDQVAGVGLPVVAYNNPVDTRVDLTPELLADLRDAHDEIVAVKEFSGDVRRIYRLQELSPQIDFVAGADDRLLELTLAGAVGWIAGFPNALPGASARLFELATAGDLAPALTLYRHLHPVYRWDTRPEFIQAIKLCMDLVGRYGGPTRLPRLPLPDELAAQVRKDVEVALAAEEVAAAMTPARAASDA